MENEDCIIGYLCGYEDSRLVAFDDVVDESENSLCSYSLQELLDRRCSTHLIRFNYCPICGKKIDWKKLREYAK